MESVGVNNYFENFGCEEETSGGDVESRKGCSVVFCFFVFFVCVFCFFSSFCRRP